MSDLLFFKDEHIARLVRDKFVPKKNVVIDAFSLVYSRITSETITRDEALALVGTVAIFDVECYKNFFMVMFRFENGKTAVFKQDEHHQLDIPKLAWIINNFCLVGYFSKVYDIPMIQLACKHVSNDTLYKATQDIIIYDLRTYQFEKKYSLGAPPTNHVDLVEVAPLRGSLKLYAGRLHTNRMQDLPIDPTEKLTEDDKVSIEEYCGNDLINTEMLLKDLEEQMMLRLELSNQYQVDLRSKSDAQIAEAVISSEVAKITGQPCKRPNIASGTRYYYNIPDFISYRTPLLRDMLEVVRAASFAVDDNGYIDMPDSIGKLKLTIGGCTYAMGIGGLHSTEKSIAHYADDDTILCDRDVVSYYPRIILNQKLYPKHLGPAFLTVYGVLVDSRVDDKKRAGECEKSLKPLWKIAEPSPVERALIKNLETEMKTCNIKASSKKIIVNGSFGKLGSQWSVLYAPDLMIQTTITGQLALLMLIEMVEDLGISVVSANTDGVAIKCPKVRYAELEQRIKWWESITGFETEEERYKAIYSRDVNNYIAHKEKGGKPTSKYVDERLGCKVKGTYGERGSAGNSVLAKNPENLICNDAVLELIANGKPIAETICECKDIRRFVTIRNVTGGAVKSDEYLGKVIRWYYSTQMQGEINRATKGDKVPNSDRARPLMELPAVFPDDVDHERYIAAAQEILYDIGHTPRPPKVISPGPLFEGDGVRYMPRDEYAIARS